MNKREEFKKLVIMGCHPECKTYEEALVKELTQGCYFIDSEGLCLILHKTVAGYYVYRISEDAEDIISASIFVKKEGIKKIIGLPVTIGRVMQAFENKYGFSIFSSYSISSDFRKILRDWELTKENGQEADDDSQSDETIFKLLTLLE